MPAAGTVLYYSNLDTPETWTEETFRVKLKITHSIAGRSQIVQATIANPRDTRSSIYTPYRRIKIVEKYSGLTIFLGRIEATNPEWDDNLGQILIVKAKGYDQELFERKLNSDYSGLTTRSTIIEQAVTDYTYAGTVATDIEASGNSDESAAVNYTNRDISVIQFIEDLAREDYWTDETWGAAWRWNGSSWDNDTSEANSSTGTPFAFLADTDDYFYLGQLKPFIGAEFDLSTNGSYGTQTWEYWNGTAWSALVINKEYDFTTDGTIMWNLPLNWATTTLSDGTPPDSTARYYVRVSVNSVTTTATINSITCERGCGYDYRVGTDQVFKYFRRGSIPAGGPENNGLTVTIHEAETTSKRIMLSDYSFSDQPSEIITRVICKGHDNTGTLVSVPAINSTFESTYEIVKERVEYVWGSSMSNADLTTYCTNRAKALLTQQSDGLIRGEFKIVKYPYYGSGPATLIWAGDMIHIKCSPKGIDDDFLVLEFTYEEPVGITTMKVVSNIYGRGFSPFEITSILQGLRSGADITLSSARINDLVVNNAQITSLDASKITTGTLAADVKITVGNTTSGIGTAFSGARVEILPTGLRGYSTTAQTFEIKNDGSGFLGSGPNKITWTPLGVLTVPVATIQNLTIANVGAGTQTATFTLGTGAKIQTSTTATTQGIVITNSGIVGYNSSTEQFYIDSDGKAKFGGGNVVLDSTGLLLTSGADIFIGGTTGSRLQIDETGLSCYDSSSEIFKLDISSSLIKVLGNNKLSFYSGASLIGSIEISSFFGFIGNSTNIVGLEGYGIDIQGTKYVNLTAGSTDAKLSLQPSGYSYLQSEDDYDLYLTARGTGDVVITGTQISLGNSTSADMLGITSTSVVVKQTKEFVLPSSTGLSNGSIWVDGDNLKYRDSSGVTKTVQTV